MYLLASTGQQLRIASLALDELYPPPYEDSSQSAAVDTSVYPGMRRKLGGDRGFLSRRCRESPFWIAR